MHTHISACITFDAEGNTFFDAFDSDADSRSRLICLLGFLAYFSLKRSLIEIGHRNTHTHTHALSYIFSVFRPHESTSPSVSQNWRAHASGCHTGVDIVSLTKSAGNQNSKANRTHDERLRAGRMRVCVICRQNDTLNNRIKSNEAMNGLTFECFHRLLAAFNKICN